MFKMNALINSDVLITDYDADAIISQLSHFTNINKITFLKSLTFDQLQIVQDLELNSKNELVAQSKAQALLKTYPWPCELSSEAMDYRLFAQHYAEGCSGDIAFYYYVFDKCIPRRGRNKNKFFMDRLATFAKASFRELWEESQKWTINGVEVRLSPNKASSKKAALLPQTGEYAADHIIQFVQDGKCYTAEVEEKPCLSVADAIDTYKDPKTRYNANYLMLYLGHFDGVYEPGFYIHNYTKNKTSKMLPENKFPGYPEALQNIN
jgi:hypothetical protein